MNDRRGITPVQPLGVVLRVVSPVRNDDLRSPPEFLHQGFEIVHIALVSERYDLCERDAIPGAYRDVGPVAKYPFPALWLLGAVLFARRHFRVAEQFASAVGVGLDHRRVHRRQK